MRLFLFLFFITTAPLLAEDNYIFLGLDEFSMTREGPETMLAGSVTANKVHFLYDGQNIEVNGQEHKPYIAETILTSNRLIFNNDFLKFSTPLDSDNPLYMLDSINATKSDIEINTKGALIESSYLDFSFSNILIKIKDAQLNCKSDIGFTMNIDEICLKDAVIHKLGENAASVEVSSLTEEFSAALKIDLNTVIIKPHSISAEANKIVGEYDGATVSLDKGFLTCSKIDERSLDPESFFRGCLMTASSKADVLRFKSANYDISVEQAQLEIGEDFYHIDAAYSNFETGTQSTRASEFKLDCLKLPMAPDSLDGTLLIKGCVKKGDIFIGHLDPDDRKRVKNPSSNIKDIIDTDNLKDIHLDFNEDTFSLSAKSKVVFRLTFKATGKTEWNDTQDVVKFHIEKASMASFPATKMTMKILAKFINSENMSVSGNTITIKF